MKLVDILARELKEWPKAVNFYYQSKVDSEIYAVYTEATDNPADFYPKQEIIAEDRMYAEVRKSEWQSARAAYLASIQPARDPEIAAVVDKPANPWRRNRGRKTPPVPVGTRVDVKYRDGDENYGVRAGFASDSEGSHEWRVAYSWILTGESGDIMQWRYAEPQQAQGKQMAQTIDQVIDNAEAAAAEAFNPIALRDEYKRITLEFEELSQQMGKLTDRMGDIEAALRAEGFVLVEPEKHNAD